MGQIKLEKNVGGIEGLCVITPAVHGDDRGSPSAEGYTLSDGTPLCLSEKDQKWPCIGNLR